MVCITIISLRWAFFVIIYLKGKIQATLLSFRVIDMELTFINILLFINIIILIFIL